MAELTRTSWVLDRLLLQRKYSRRQVLTIDDMDLVEANEAFAAQSLAVAHRLKFDMSKVKRKRWCDRTWTSGRSFRMPYPCYTVTRDAEERR